MSHRRILTLLLALCCVAVAGAALPAAGQADPWGELAHFGNKGGELAAPVLAITAEPGTNAVYVVDASKGAKYRLQKFEKQGSAYVPVASTEFHPVGAGAEELPNDVDLAINPASHVVYLLTAAERSGKFDNEVETAAELWAFSTEPKEEKGKKVLPPAAGTEAGVLANKEAFNLQGKEAQGEPNLPILEPTGLTYDASTKQILVTGSQDQLKETAPKEFEERRIALVQAISETGKLETRWTDKANVFGEECECMGAPAATSSGKLYVIAEPEEGENGVYELPANLSSTTPAKLAFSFPEGLKEHVTQFPAQVPFEGVFAGFMATSEGKLYARDRISLVANGGNEEGAVMVLTESGGKLAEQGWVGGGSPVTEGEACSVSEPATWKPKVAVGSGEDVFMLSPESEDHSKPAKVLELGPNGSGCPHATSPPLSATVNGKELSRYALSEEVLFGTELTQANALGVEWEFRKGAKVETVDVTNREQQKVALKHKFSEEGEWTVVAKVHVDDMATGELKLEKKVNVVGAPSVKNEEAVVSGTNALLKAEVNGNFAPTAECEFEWGPAKEPTKNKVKCPVGLGEEGEYKAESIQLEHLEEGAVYHFSVHTRNATEQHTTEGKNFQVAEKEAPESTTGKAEEVASTSAKLTGVINPKGVAGVKCVFQYGTSQSYGKTAPCSTEAPSGSSGVSESARITGLSATTPYHFQVVAEYERGGQKRQAVGKDETFTTTEPGVKPTAKLEAPSEVRQRQLRFNGKVNPGGLPAEKCVFEYGHAAASENQAPCSSAPTGRSEVAVSAEAKGLEPGQAYKFRLFVKNEAGEERTEEREATTLPKAAPGAVTEGAAGVSQHAATLTGKAEPKGEAVTRCEFEYGTSLPSGLKVPCTALPGNGTTAVGVSAAIGSLNANTTYRFRLLVENAAKESSAGAEQVFTTPAEPAPKPTTNPTPTPTQGVKPSIEEKPAPQPTVTVAGTSLSVSGAGAFTMKLSCPANETSCAGTVTVKTLTAVAAVRGASAKAKKAILTLATASFTISGGQLKTVTLHLSKKAKALLSKSHTLRARATIVAHDPHGVVHTTSAIVTLKAKKKH